MEKQGAQFLHSKQPSLHVGAVVEHEQARRERSGGETSQKPTEKIAAWLEILERTHGHADSRVNDRIKSSYRKEYVIKPENVPESTFQLEQRIARNLGHGDIPITDEFRAAKTREIIENQEASLDKWIDYLTSDDAIYPTWAKYWAFTSIVKMGKIEKKTVKLEDGTERETARFGTRTRDTTAPFPPLNPRALAMAVGVMERHLAWKALPKDERKTSPLVNESKRLSDEEFRRLLTSESFDDLYTQFLIELPEYSTEGLRETRGAWQKFDQGSDPAPLVESLDGHPLEWCTANFSTALTQLQGGDFYVYYSIDQDGNPTIPRVAIRMEGDSIVEVRGIAPNQQLDPYIAEVVEEKMTEFPDAEAYQKKASDMARLTEIEERVQAGGELGADDLRFIYEIDSKIHGFGYNRDPRIDQLLQGRGTRADLAMALGYKPEQISLTEAEAMHGTAEDPILFHYGDLLLDRNLEAELQGKAEFAAVVLPRTVSGDIRLNVPYQAEGLVLPQRVGGTLYCRRLESAKGLTLPQSIGGNLDLDGLESADGLVLPRTIEGDLTLSGLTRAEGLVLPPILDGTLYLDGLEGADGLVLPQRVGGLHLKGLLSIDGLVLPEDLGDLSLTSLKSAEGLVLPSRLKGSLNLSSLKSAEGLVLPSRLKGSLNLSSLKSAEGLVLPRRLNGSLWLNDLTETKGLFLPEVIGGALALNRITSADGLSFPHSVGVLSLTSLTDTTGLVLPANISRGMRLAEYGGGGAGGYVRVSGLTAEQIRTVLSQRPDLRAQLEGVPPWILGQPPH
jgi:hypothetical protein